LGIDGEMMKEESQNKNKDLLYKVYLEERKSLIDAEREGASFFDKAILTLTAGAFGLSLTFINQIVPSIKYGTFFLLVIGWAGFVVSLLATLTSFLTSQSACRRQIQIIEHDFLGKGRGGKNVPARMTHLLNIVSISTFILGAIFLALFVTINLRWLEEAMEKNKPGKIDEGYVPPKKPTTPGDTDKKGFVPPRSPEKPPDKPAKKKK
jgi:hypothetical protein